jgi:surface antigen/methyl-accepting chemotaxis protein
MNRSFELLASGSRFAVAAAIIYFAYQVSQINASVSVVTQSVDQISRHIEPTLKQAQDIRLEIAATRKLIPDILAEVAEVRKQIPAIVTEVAEVRKQIPAIVAEVAEVRRQIPPILKRIDAINQQIEPILLRVDETQRQIPLILTTADDAILALNDTRKEVLPYLPKALEEIRLMRESIDPTLDRVDTLVDDAFIRADQTIASARAAGKEASEGAVSGFFTGLVKLPFSFMGSVASPLVSSIDADVATQMTEKDFELLAETANRAHKSKQSGKDWTWENPASGNSGSITLVREFKLRGQNCIEARNQISIKGKLSLDDETEYCLDADDKWIKVSNIEK